MSVCDRTLPFNLPAAPASPEERVPLARWMNIAPAARQVKAAPPLRYACSPPVAGGSCAGSSAGAAWPWRSQRTRPRLARLGERWGRHVGVGSWAGPPRAARRGVRRPPRRGGARSSHALA